MLYLRKYITIQDIVFPVLINQFSKKLINRQNLQKTDSRYTINISFKKGTLTICNDTS